jgi:photosystem II stability/assembly factor-like uncharacterized protein
MAPPARQDPFGHRWFPRLRGLVGAAFVALACTAAAGAEWTAVGPLGGGVTAFALDPQDSDVAYAAVAGDGLWRTRDGGTSWQPVGARDPLFGLNALAVHPRHPRWLYATQHGGFLRSRDGGRTWTPANRGLPRFFGVVRASGLALAPTDPRILYVVVLHRDEGERPYRSEDGGVTWRAASVGLEQCRYSLGAPLAVHPHEPQAVMFGCDRGVFLSVNGGRRWVRAAAPLAGKVVMALAFDPARPARLYVTTVRGASSLLHVSPDGGKTWSVRPALPRARFGALAPAPAEPGTLYLGSLEGHVLRSPDTGRTWQAVHDALPPLGEPAIIGGLFADPRVQGRLWALSGRFGQAAPGLYKTDTAGLQWRAAAPSARAAGVRRVEPSAGTPGTLVALSRGPYPVQRSVDGGKTWVPATTGLAGLVVRDLVADPLAPATLYVATSGGVLRSLDAGQTWARWGDSSTAPGSVGSLAIGGGEPRRLYATTDLGLAFSHDGGESWQPWTGTGLLLDVLVAPSAPEVVYGVQVGCIRLCFFVLVRSFDGGLTWELAGAQQWRTPLMVDAADPDRVYFSAPASIGRLDIGGGGFTSLAIPGAPEDVSRALAQDLHDPARLVVGMASGAVWESRDGGESWERRGDSLGAPVDHVTLDPLDPALVYAATAAGLFVDAAP